MHRVVVLMLLIGLLLPTTSWSAGLMEITEFGPNPSALRMHVYVPDRLVPNPPVLLAVHYCTGSGPAFHEGGGFSELADVHGFIVVYPSATREGHCFDVSSQAALTRNGGSDPVSIISMLNHALVAWSGDATEVYVTGVSSGAMMTQVLLALYPEVFKAGVVFAGVPFTCFATTVASGWSNACADGQVIRTAEEWGEVVRDANPEYTGTYPRIQLWHGTADEGLNYVNFGEAIKQWSNVHGLDPEAAEIDSTGPGLTRYRFGTPFRGIVVEAFSLEGVGHDLPVDAAEAIRFMGLDEESAATSLWRPFSPDSPWNMPIPDEAALDPESERLIVDFADRGPLYVNIKEWSIPVYYVDSANTPLHDVADSRPGVYGKGFEPPRAIPIPIGATASLPVGGDEHLSIVDKGKGIEWGMWQARRVGGQWMTGLGATTDLMGSGVAPPWDSVQREFDAHRARAAGFPLIAGLIRVEEIQSGYIPHALVFAYDYVRTEHYIPPASTAQASTGFTRNNQDGMPMGAHIRLDPLYDVEASGLSPAGKIIARALQKYGAFLGDFAGGNVIYAESAPEALQAWEGLLASDDLENVFTPDMMKRQFQLLDMGEVRKGQNFGE